MTHARDEKFEEMLLSLLTDPQEAATCLA